MGKCDFCDKPCGQPHCITNREIKYRRDHRDVVIRNETGEKLDINIVEVDEAVREIIIKKQAE